MTYYTEYPSPAGLLTIACDGEDVTGLWIAGQKYFAAGLGAAERQDTAPGLRAPRSFLARYFTGENPDPSGLRLKPRGTPFQRQVWEALRAIPSGGPATYAALAARLHTSPRAIGAAVGRNPISILIPCHRVLGADGSLTGYAGGIEVKRFLLQLEGGV